MGRAAIPLDPEHGRTGKPLAATDVLIPCTGGRTNSRAFAAIGAPVRTTICQGFIARRGALQRSLTGPRDLRRSTGPA
jgi:hypothetical protein